MPFDTHRKKRVNGVASNTQSLTLCLYDMLSHSPKVTSWILICYSINYFNNTIVDSVSLIPVFLHDNLYHRVAQIPVIPKIIFVGKDNTMIWQLCSSLLKNQLLGSFFI